MGEGKAALRRRMRALRDGMAAEERARLSARACERLLALPGLQGARTVAVYRAFGSELDLHGLVAGLAARPGGVRLAAPVALAGREMAFVEVAPDELPAAANGTDAGMPPGSRGESGLPDFLRRPGRVADGIPAGRAVVRPQDVDVVVVPGLAFDRGRYRLGYGGGYYDAWLARAADGGGRPFACGVCFDCQVVDGALPHGPHDARLDAVVTPSRAMGADAAPSA